MNRIEVDAFTAQHNWAVIRLPERALPGVVIQGDSLSILVSQLAEAKASLESGDTASGLKIVEEILTDLQQVKAGYERALAAYNIRLPN